MKSFKTRKRQYAVLGLGIFGSTVAKTLSSYDREVLAVDIDIKCVNRMADIVTQAIQCDVTDIEQLKKAGVGDCDVAIVGMGTHLEETVLGLINLKELGVPYIIAKAKNKRYMQIFSSVGADYVVRPEKSLGVQVAKSLLSTSIIDMVGIDDEFSMVELETPKSWIGYTLRDLDIRNRYGMNVLGVRKEGQGKLNISLDPDYTIEKEDHLVIITDMDGISKLDSLDNDI